jgi:hypothetical protein
LWPSAASWYSWLQPQHRQQHQLPSHGQPDVPAACSVRFSGSLSVPSCSQTAARSSGNSQQAVRCRSVLPFVRTAARRSTTGRTCVTGSPHPQAEEEADRQAAYMAQLQEEMQAAAQRAAEQAGGYSLWVVCVPPHAPCVTPVYSSAHLIDGTAQVRLVGAGPDDRCHLDAAYHAIVVLHVACGNTSWLTWSVATCMCVIIWPHLASIRWSSATGYNQ